MKRRTYKAGRDTGRWRKGDRVTSLAEIKPGDLLIKDSHQFRASNLVKVASLRSIPVSFTFNYAMPTGAVIKEPLMTTHEFELAMGHDVFYRAVK